MSITTRTCLVVTCTRCGEVDDEFQTLHADTLDQLRDWLKDWHWSDPNTPELCPGCAARLACERDSHQWGEWWPRIADPSSRFRFCERCSAAESDPPLRPAVTA
ncbi:hypothetical protein ACWDRB_60470 [Nonomuraea sp. NPDC003707]